MHISLSLIQRSRFGWVGTIVMGIGLLAATRTLSQTKAIEPEQLILSGTRNSVETRQIFIQTPNKIENFQVIPIDLLGTDGVTVFPAEGGIVAPDSIPVMGKDNQAIVPVTFNLGKASTSGEYIGMIRLSYDSAEMRIPVMLRVKDNPLMPLLILLAGTGLGLWVSFYRIQGQPRNNILVRMAQLQTQMGEDPERQKAESFQVRVNSLLINVRLAVQGEQWLEAQQAMEQAEQIWHRWLWGRLDWIVLLGYYTELMAGLQNLDQQSPFVQTVHRQLSAILQQIPDFEHPQQFHDALREKADCCNQYQKLKQDLHQLQQSIPEPPADLLRVAQQIDQISPSPSELDQLQGQVTEMVTQLSLEYPHSTPTVTLPSPPVMTIQRVQPTPLDQTRLQVVRGIRTAIALVFLAGAGWIILYVDNPTYGAQPWKDYLALMAWGFGAEATRDGIKTLILNSR